jgi:hypothetical protein
MSEPKFTVKLTVPTVARRCIRCAQLISLAWVEIPIVDNRRAMNIVARFYAHPSAEACADDLALAARLTAGEIPAPHDIMLQRAALLRELLNEAVAAQVKAMPDLHAEPEPEPAAPNYARQTRGARERRGVKPYGGLI